MGCGRLRLAADPQFEAWQRSFPFDQKLLLYELAASSGHAHALREGGILSAEEWDRIVEGLSGIARHAQEDAGYLDDHEAEDVHHFVEKKLVDLIGETGKKLHTGRSRNEQIATDLRLFVRENIDELRSIIPDFLEVLVARAEEAKSTVMPAYTPIQRTQPALVPHWLTAS